MVLFLLKLQKYGYWRSGLLVWGIASFHRKAGGSDAIYKYDRCGIL